MKTKLLTTFLMVLAITSGQSMAENGKISITAGYRERIALPSDAVLEVELLDVSRADAPSIRLSSQLFSMDRVPLSVDLHYDPSIIDDRMTYSVAARLLSKGRVMFRTTSAYPVITREAPTRVDVVLQMMPQENNEPVSDQRIAGVPWALSELGGRAFVGDDNPTIVFDTDGTFSLFGGCNRFRGKAELVEGRLAFPRQFAGTKMVCPDPRMQLEGDVLEALAATVRFHRTGQSLAFANESGLTTARFEERPD